MTLYSLSIHLTMSMADSSDDKCYSLVFPTEPGHFNVVGKGGGQIDGCFFSSEHIWKKRFIVFRSLFLVSTPLWHSTLCLNTSILNLFYFLPLSSSFAHRYKEVTILWYNIQSCVPFLISDQRSVWVKPLSSFHRMFVLCGPAGPLKARFLKRLKK